MRRRCDRHYGLGPLFFDGEAGAPPAATGEAGGSGAPAPAAPPAPPALPAADNREGFIPRERFDEVNGELQKLRQAEEERQRKDLEQKGEHQKLAEQEKARREAAEARAVGIARRAAFIAAAAGKVADPEAAYKLANADGLLNDLDVDDDGNAKDSKAPEKLVDEVVKRYEFLKAQNGTGRGYGGDRSGAGGAPELPPNATARDMISAGYAQGSGRQRGT